jgi:hypothetical protein
MEKFFIPTDRARFVSWLLQTANRNHWTIVLEYSDEQHADWLEAKAKPAELPPTAGHHYQDDYRLTAITSPASGESFAHDLLAYCSVLSVHNRKEMLFLIADDFHFECFSCTPAFFETHYPILTKLGLIRIDQDNEKTRFEKH